MTRRFSLHAGAAGLALSRSGTVAFADGEPARGGMLVAVIQPEPSSLTSVVNNNDVELDHDRRKALFGELQILTMTDLPILPLTEMRHVTLHNRRVRGLGRAPDAALAALSNVWPAR